MRRIETVATVTHDGMLTIPIPADVRPGPHTVIVEIDERPSSAEHPHESSWLSFVHETEGAWHGDVERLTQGDFERRTTF